MLFLGHPDVGSGARGMSAGSPGREQTGPDDKAFFSVGTGGALLPASSTEISAPWNVKLSLLASEPSDRLDIWMDVGNSKED